MKVIVELDYHEDNPNLNEIATTLKHLSEIINERHQEGSGMDVETGAEFTWAVHCSRKEMN